MRIAICDDDQAFIHTLLHSLEQYFTDNHLKQPEYVCYTSGEELLRDPEQMDIIFLDIQMPGMDGIHVGQALKARHDKLILFMITAYASYLDDAMSFHVFRYLSKPLDTARLRRNMQAALRQYHAITRKIGIETSTGVYTIYASDILLVEAIDRKVIIHTKERDYLSVHTMAYWKENLTENCFYQTHRSFIVNMKHITHFDNSLIYMEDGRRAYLTRRKYPSFRDAYLLYLESTQ